MLVVVRRISGDFLAIDWLVDLGCVDDFQRNVITEFDCSLKPLQYFVGLWVFRSHAVALNEISEWRITMPRFARAHLKRGRAYPLCRKWLLASR
jgi:hypothetical protein